MPAGYDPSTPFWPSGLFTSCTLRTSRSRSKFSESGAFPPRRFAVTSTSWKRRSSGVTALGDRAGQSPGARVCVPGRYTGYWSLGLDRILALARAHRAKTALRAAADRAAFGTFAQRARAAFRASSARSRGVSAAMRRVPPTCPLSCGFIVTCEVYLPWHVLTRRTLARIMTLARIAQRPGQEEHQCEVTASGHFRSACHYPEHRYRTALERGRCVSIS